MKVQKTFYGEYSQGTAIEWLYNLSKCFKITNSSMKCYSKRVYSGMEERCQIKVTYK